MQHLRIALTTCDNVVEPGGVENSVVRIARGLSTNHRSRVDILMLNPDSPADFRPTGHNGITKLDLGIAKVNVFQLSPWSGGAHESHRWTDIHYALIETCKERRYNLVHGFYGSTAGFPTVFAARELQLPSIVSFRGSDINKDVFHVRRFHHLRWAIQNSTDFTAVSNEILNRARIIGECHRKGRVILNSIRASDFVNGKQSLDLPSPVIGTLGVFKTKKGLEVLLCGFKLFLDRYPTSHLLMIGNVVEDDKKLFESLVEKYSLNGKFTITGFVAKQDVLRYLHNIDVFAFPSLHDGCPNVILEAMLAGLPIVATTSGAVPSLIQDGTHGFLIEPGSAAELCEALVRMFSVDRHQLGKQARERVVNQFTPDRELQEYLSVYHEAVTEFALSRPASI